MPTGAVTVAEALPPNGTEEKGLEIGSDSLAEVVASKSVEGGGEEEGGGGGGLASASFKAIISNDEYHSA